MERDTKEALKPLKLNRVFIPVLLGVVITLGLFYRSGKFSSHTIDLLRYPNWPCLLMAIVSIFFREFGHIFRLRLLSDGSLSWKACFYVAILWEFASAVTPSVVGGGIVAIFILSKEGLSWGRALAYVIVSGILDNFFFLVAAFQSFLGGYEALFNMVGEFSGSVKTIFFTNYVALFCYTILIALGVFKNPKLLKWLLLKITSFAFLKRLRRRAYQLSQEIMITAREFMGKSWAFWWRLILCTMLTWIMRYLFLNCLIASYIPLGWLGHITVLKKQIIMWTLMLVPIAPGGSGIAELLFQAFFESTLGQYTLLILVLWRSCSFYIYLTLGLIFLPRWIKRVFVKHLS